MKPWPTSGKRRCPYMASKASQMCVYTSETECKIISPPVPSPPEDIVWTENSPGNQSHFFLWNFSTVTAKNEPIKRDLNGFFVFLTIERVCVLLVFMTVDWIRAKQNYFLSVWRKVASHWGLSSCYALPLLFVCA